MKLENIFILFATLFVLASCSQDGAETLQPQEPETQIYKLYLHSSFEGFDSRGEGKTYEPKDGDVMLLFSNDGVWTIAEYIEEGGYWKLYHKFPDKTHGLCFVTYCGADVSSDVNHMRCNINSKTALFEDNNAVYTFTDWRNIDLYTTLKPKTCRFRFRSHSPYSFRILGLGYYTYVECRYYEQGDILTPLSTTTEAVDGGYYSSYHYCFPVEKPLLIQSGDYAYRWKKDTNTYFKAGKNGVIEMPDVKPENWIKETYRHWKYGDITVQYSDSGQWTQETLATTRYETSFGLRYNLTCTFYLKDLSSDSYPFQIKIEALNDNGDVVDTRLIKLSSSDCSVNSSKTFDDYFYHKDASAYRFSFYRNKIHAKITDFSLRNF